MIRGILSILLTLAIQSGLLARLAIDAAAVPLSAIGDDHAVALAGHAPDAGYPGTCPDGSHSCPDAGKCPFSDQHHQHHGTCVHDVQITSGEDAACALIPPTLLLLEFLPQNLRTPDGPVRDLDKPPLI